MNQKDHRPTDAELDILQVLWKEGPCSVKEVLGYLDDNPPRGYTTILKLLQIMTQKGLVKRVKKERAHIYAASSSAAQTQSNMLSHFLKKVFDGSSSQLIMQALSTKKASKDELGQIRKLLDDIEGDMK